MTCSASSSFIINGEGELVAFLEGEWPSEAPDAFNTAMQALLSRCALPL